MKGGSAVLSGWKQQEDAGGRLPDCAAAVEQGEVTYMLKNWERLTLFLREPEAPLDSNKVEASLKRAILHRKNSLFCKTLNGGHVGDVFMSLIHSAELNKVHPFEYFVAL